MKWALAILVAVLGAIVGLEWLGWPPSPPQQDGDDTKTSAPGASATQAQKNPLDVLAPLEDKGQYAVIMERPLFLPDRRPPEEEPEEADRSNAGAGRQPQPYRSQCRADHAERDAGLGARSGGEGARGAASGGRAARLDSEGDSGGSAGPGATGRDGYANIARLQKRAAADARRGLPDLFDSRPGRRRGETSRTARAAANPRTSSPCRAF